LLQLKVVWAVALEKSFCPDSHALHRGDLGKYGPDRPYRGSNKRRISRQYYQ
jgi:hypothetical protein